MRSYGYGAEQVAPPLGMRLERAKPGWSPGLRLVQGSEGALASTHLGGGLVWRSRGRLRGVVRGTRSEPQQRRGRRARAGPAIGKKIRIWRHWNLAKVGPMTAAPTLSVMGPPDTALCRSTEVSGHRRIPSTLPTLPDSGGTNNARGVKQR